MAKKAPEIKYVVAKDAADLDKIVALAIRSVHKAKLTVHIAAVAIACHAGKHGDYTKANDLINGVAGLNRSALVEWFSKYTGLIVGEDSKGFAGWKGEQFIRDNLEASKATPWYELKPDAPFVAYNAELKAQMFIKQFNKALKSKAGLTEEQQAEQNFTVSEETFKSLMSILKGSIDSAVMGENDDSLTEAKAA